MIDGDGMKKKIIIIFSIIVLIAGILFLTLTLSNYRYKCTRMNVVDEEIFYLKFNIFGKFKNLKYENILYFDTEKEAREYYEVEKKRFSEDEIVLENKKVIYYSDDYYMTNEEVENKEVAKKTFEGNGYTCEKIK